MALTPKPDIFKQTLNALGGPALPCHYAAIVTPPPAFVTGAAFGLAGPILGPIFAVAAMADMAFMVESCSIPGRQIRTTNHSTYGSYRRMPVGVDYPTFMMTFICTNSMLERHVFDIWHNYIMSTKSQYMGYYDDIIGEITIKKLTDSGILMSTAAGSFPVTPNVPQVELGDTLSIWTFTEAYPVSIQAQELNNANGDYMRITVEFTYKYWTTLLSSLLDPGSGFT